MKTFSFAGPPSKKPRGLYVATGFNGWGITNGTAAGLLIADRITTGTSPWSALYDPARPASNSSGVVSSKVPRAVSPAALTRPSIRPCGMATPSPMPVD